MTDERNILKPEITNHYYFQECPACVALRLHGPEIPLAGIKETK